MTEALPISVTALLPVFMFPLVGVLPAAEVGKVYFNVRCITLLGSLPTPERYFPRKIGNSVSF